MGGLGLGSNYDRGESAGIERRESAMENRVYLAKGPIVGAIMIAFGIITAIGLVVYIILSAMR